MFTFRNNIEIPPNSFKLFNLFGLTKSVMGAPQRLRFSNTNVETLIQNRKLLIKSVKAYYSITGASPSDNIIANKILTNTAKELVGYQSSFANGGFIPRESLAFKATLGLVRLLINEKPVLFTDTISHPCIELDNLFLFVDDPVQSFDMFIADVSLCTDEGIVTTEDLTAYVEIGAYLI